MKNIRYTLCELGSYILRDNPRTLTIKLRGTDAPLIVKMHSIATGSIMAFIVGARADLVRSGQNIGPPAHAAAGTH